MNARYIIQIKPDGGIKKIEVPGGGPDLELLQKLVEGFIETVPTKYPGGDSLLICNEEGLLRGMPKNEIATKVSKAYALMGPAVLLELYYNQEIGEYDFIGYSLEAANMIMKALKDMGGYYDKQ